MKLSKKTIIIIVSAIVIISAGYLYFSGEEKEENSLTKAEKTDIIQEVSVTGKVKPAENVDLAFEKSGKVTTVNARIGSWVIPGQSIVELDSSELSAQLEKAEADLTASEADREKSMITLTNYYLSTEDTLNDAYVQVNDAVRKQLDNLFSNDEKTPELTFSTSNAQKEIDIELRRLKQTAELANWLEDLRGIGLSPSFEEIDALISSGERRLILARELLDIADEIIAGDTNLPSATASAYRDNIITARTNVNTAFSNLNSKKQNISEQKSTISYKEASVKSSEASISNIKAQIEKLVLRSPIYGTVTKQEAEVGEIIQANVIIVSVISSGSFEIEANVPEADIAKIKIGNYASVTLDAYGNDAFFEAKVISIDPAETVIEGVPTYKITLQFSKNDKRIKSGMTANTDVATAKKENVIVIPQRSVITRGASKFVLVDSGGEKPEEREIETGLKGSDGNIEVLKGIEEGEMVFTFGEL